MTLTPEQRSARASLASDASWGRTVNRTQRTAPARRAFDQRFLVEAQGDPVRAESLRKAHFKQMAWKSARSRQRTANAKNTRPA